mgnify:FL=1
MPKKNDFFEEEKVEEEGGEQAPTTIKLGEKEYTQEQLQGLVKLGELGQEMESKWKTSLTSVWPDYTKKSQQLKDLEKEAEGLRQFKQEKELEASRVLESKPESELSPEQVEAKVKAEARKYGFVTKEDFRQYYAKERDSERLIEEAQSLVEEVTKEGKPATTLQELLEYMRDNDIKKVDSAYKQMKEAELDEWKEKQLKSIKRPGMVTQETTTAGSSKQPERKKLRTEEDLKKALTEHFSQTEE